MYGFASPVESSSSATSNTRVVVGGGSGGTNRRPASSPDVVATWGFSSSPSSFDAAVRSEVQRIFSGTETCKKTSVETVKLRVLDRVLECLDLCSADLMRIHSPEIAFVHPQVSAKLHALFDRPKMQEWKKSSTGRLLDRVSASDYNDSTDVKDLIELLENIARICVDLETVFEIRWILACDGLGDCSRHLRYPLVKETSVRVRPIGSDYNAERVHTEAVRKLYEVYRKPAEQVMNAILEFYEERGDLTGTRPKNPVDPISPMGQTYAQCVGSFADQVWREVVEPKVIEEKKADSEQKRT